MGTRNIYCLSGGDKGTDSVFALIGKESRLYTTLSYSFNGHITYSGIRIEIEDNKLFEYINEYEKISNLMGRKITNRIYNKKNILRSFFQIYGRKKFMSELVIIVGELEKNTVNIIGDNGYAIRTAMKEKIPIILIDKKDNYSYKFFNYHNGCWRVLLENDLDNINIEKGFTGIGCKDIDINKTRIKIIKLFEKLF